MIEQSVSVKPIKGIVEASILVLFGLTSLGIALFILVKILRNIKNDLQLLGSIFCLIFSALVTSTNLLFYLTYIIKVFYQGNEDLK